MGIQRERAEVIEVSAENSEYFMRREEYFGCLMILNEISEAFDSKGSDSMERREKRSFEELSDDPTVNARLNVEAKFGANAEEFEYWFL